jgi:hypothetical protein
MSLFGFNKKRELSSYRLSLIITHVPTGYTVEFPAFLDMFSDAFTQTWNSEDVYGRMDPIATFINTRRAISLAWNVPAQSYYDAQMNLKKVNTLMSFMYPLYEDSSGGATAINQAPLLRIKFGNLVQNAQTGDGLLGYVNGFTFDPDLSQGMFYQEGAGKGNSSTGAEYYPKTFRLNAELNVLHEHSLGFQRSNKAGTSFSYAAPGIDNTEYPYAASGVRPDFASAQVTKSEPEPINNTQPTSPRPPQPPSLAEQYSFLPTVDPNPVQQVGVGTFAPEPVSEAVANPDSVANSIQPGNIAPQSAAQKAMNVPRNTGRTLEGDAASAFSAYRNRS